jgi:hypothetical protein
MSDATATSTAQPAPSLRTAGAVEITGVDIPFARLVLFFIKAGFAAIPAVIVLMLMIGVAGALMRGLFRLGSWGLHGGYYGW